MQNGLRKIFLASNSAQGFTSFFGNCYDPRGGWRAFIIKGGPGTGKSTLMKTVTKSARAIGYDPIPVYCSSDPDSLDGVIINERKTVILDGTAPHVAEPSFFGVCERIVIPGEHLDFSALEAAAPEIIGLFDQNRFYHLTAARYLAALGQIKKDNARRAARFLDTAAVNAYVKRLADKYFGKAAAKPGNTFNCFISAYTPSGRVNFTETPALWCENFVVIEDRYGAAANHMIRYLAAAAKTAGFDTVRLCDPLFPDTAEHLLVPGASLAFLCENRDIRFPVEARRLHTRRFYNTAELDRRKKRLRFNEKLISELENSAVQNLKKAKKTHDLIESYYVNAMDFSAREEITQKLLKQIFDKKMK